jgi:3-methyladenine DNA glycosylase AlkD
MLKASSNRTNLEGMRRLGIQGKHILGSPGLPAMRGMAKTIGGDDQLALRLWDSEIHEARILASMVADPKKATAVQVERWANDFESWDVCDQVCSNCLDKTEFAYRKADEWSRREEEFVKRAGFVLMAALAVHDRRTADTRFLAFLKTGSAR